MCLAAGIIVGLTNGALVRYVGINSVITTIAMLSVVQGIALYLRPSPFGVISEDFIDFFQTRVGFIPVSFFVILAAAIARRHLALSHAQRPQDSRRRLSRGGGQAQWRAHRFRPHARLSCCPPSSPCSAGSSSAPRSASATPVIGSSYTLTSIAAAVLGGAALTGGRGSFVGALLGALFFTLTVNIIALLGLNTGAGIMTSGALTLFAVALYSGLQPIRRVWANIRRHVRPPAAR